jgi:hypothetical protein
MLTVSMSWQRGTPGAREGSRSRKSRRKKTKKEKQKEEPHLCFKRP